MEHVQVYNFKTREVTELPVAELGPGMIRCTIQGMPGTYWVDAGEAKYGPARHTAADIRARFGKRIEAFRRALRQVCPMTYRDLVEGFCGDTHPEREVETWERIAACYTRTVANGAWDRTQRGDIYNLFLTASFSGAPEQAVAAARLDRLSPAEALEIVSTWPPPPPPAVN